MHGIHIAEDIVKKAHAQGKIKKAVIVVGELANITAEDLDKHLKSIADFPYELKKQKAIVDCMCGYKGEAQIVERQHDIVIHECPVCGMTPEIESGNKVILKSVDI